MTRWAWLPVAAALTPATQATPPVLPCRPDASGVQEIRAVATGIVAADNRRDIERVLAYYTADAVLMPPGETEVIGRDRIRPRYEALFANFTPEIDLQIHQTCAAGGLGFVRGRNGGRLVPRASGDVRLLNDVFVMLLRLEPDGAWRISHLIWHRQDERSDQ